MFVCTTMTRILNGPFKYCIHLLISPLIISLLSVMMRSLFHTTKDTNVLLVAKVILKKQVTKVSRFDRDIPKSSSSHLRVRSHLI